MYHIHLDPLRLVPWSGITITPDLKSLIGLGRRGIFIYHWPYKELAFSDEGIIILEYRNYSKAGKEGSGEKNLGPSLPQVERGEGS